MELVYKSDLIHRTLNMCRKYAQSNASVLLTGESGVGKEEFAEFIQKNSKIADKTFIKINCAAIPRELVELEFFGSTRGSYTSSIKDVKGVFDEVDGGTLFLDEISEMPFELQSKLLRVLQDRKYKPIGSQTFRSVECRIISATNVCPKQAILDKKLRPDLYYRLSELIVEIAPLRHRPDDIIHLAEYFVAVSCEIEQKPHIELSERARQYLLSYDWPGNVRQLKSEIRRAVIICENNLIEPKDFSFLTDAPTNNNKYNKKEERERNMIIEQLKMLGGNRVLAARSLCMGRSTLYKKLKKYEIEDLYLV